MTCIEDFFSCMFHLSLLFTIITYEKGKKKYRMCKKKKPNRNVLFGGQIS